jgi:hypothetical protein
VGCDDIELGEITPVEHAGRLRSALQAR